MPAPMALCSRLPRACAGGGASSGLEALRARCVEEGWAQAMAGELRECR